jgi:hypothetical protein
MIKLFLIIVTIVGVRCQINSLANVSKALLGKQYKGIWQANTDARVQTLNHHMAAIQLFDCFQWGFVHDLR